jgi:hypothetical protein
MEKLEELKIRKKNRAFRADFAPSWKWSKILFEKL